jgi:hypothetical protein
MRCCVTYGQEAGLQAEELQGQSKIVGKGTCSHITILENIKNYRQQGWPVIYTDETYMILAQFFLVPVKEDQWVLIPCARNENGFIPFGALMFKLSEMLQFSWQFEIL